MITATAILGPKENPNNTVRVEILEPVFNALKTTVWYRCRVLKTNAIIEVTLDQLIEPNEDKTTNPS